MKKKKQKNKQTNKKANVKYFCVNISTPPFHLDLWGKVTIVSELSDYPF